MRNGECDDLSAGKGELVKINLAEVSLLSVASGRTLSPTNVISRGGVIFPTLYWL
jgi:hypothetical protein